MAQVNLKSRLQSSGPLVLDGGLASELERRGHELSDHLWSARLLRDQPDEIRAVHRAYLEAGADIITTASYQATMPGFQSAGLSKSTARELILRSVELARAAVDESCGDDVRPEYRPWVAASVGPYGAYLADGSEYRGDYALGSLSLRIFHESRWEALTAAAPDLLLCETIPSSAELSALIELAEEHCSIPVWISLQCRDSTTLADGTPLADCLSRIDRSAAIHAVGVNCVPPDRVAPLLELLSNSTQKPLVVYPNSGEAWNSHSRRWEGAAALDRFGQLAADWIGRGAAVIGGCCRTRPEHIAALRKMLPR